MTSQQRERGDLTRNLEDTKSQLNQTARELAIANRVKDEFLSLVSHELRTPLTTIIAVSEYLAESSSAGDDTEKEVVEEAYKHPLG